MIRTLAAALLALAPAQLRAEPSPLTLTAYWENDGAYVKSNNPTDGHYTSGALLLLSYQPPWAEALADAVPGAQAFGATRTGAGYFFGQQIFTPDDIDTAALIPGDRPYTGYLFAGAYWQRASATTLDHVQLEIGAVGDWALGEEAQNWVHTLIDDEPVDGWDNQIPHAVTVQLTVRRKWRIDLLPCADDPLQARNGFGVDLIPALGVGLGTVKRQADAGGVLRAGWNLPDDFGPTRIDDLAGGPAPQTAGLGAYVYGRVGGRAVQHDAFIDGADFTPDPKTDVDSSPLVGEVEAGVNVRYRRGSWAFELGYAQVFTTGSFEQQSGGDERGAMRLAATCGF